MGNFRKIFLFFLIFFFFFFFKFFFSAQNLHIKGALWVILEKYFYFF